MEADSIFQDDSISDVICQLMSLFKEVLVSWAYGQCKTIITPTLPYKTVFSEAASGVALIHEHEGSSNVFFEVRVLEMFWTESLLPEK